MSNNRVVLKRSSVSGKIPVYDTLEYGELALNYNDGKLYYRTSEDTVNYFSVLNDSLSAVIDKRSYTITTAGTNTLTVTYEIGFLDVSVNGVRLPPSEFTATSGSNVEIPNLEIGDEVILDGYKAFQVSVANKYDRQKYTATEGQDTFDVDYQVLDGGSKGVVQVFLNGILLKESDYTATSGTDIVLSTSASLDDVVECIGYSDFSIFNLEASGSGLSYNSNTGTFTLNSSSSNTASTVVFRDASGDFSANVITAEGGINVGGHIIPDADITHDLGSTNYRFRDLYLSGTTINLGDTTLSSTGDGQLSVSGVVTSQVVLGENTISVDPDGQIVLPEDTKLGGAQLPPVNLTIAPEVLEIQVAAPEAGDDTRWFWTWLQSTLPYARATITNSPQLTVPLYKKGAYVINNYAANEIFDQMTQTHHATLKWVDGAGHDNDVEGWVTYQDNVSTSHPDINGGNPTLVQRITVNVPEVVTPPTLTLPVGIGYDVSFSTPGAYTFGANMGSGSDMSSVAHGDNPTIGPLYRGATYTFHLDSSLSGHPFYITTDNGQGFIVGQYVGEYTSGVVGSRNNGSAGQETLTFTVPLDAPDNLYYQCAYHGSMRGVMTIKDLAVEVNNNGNYVLYFQHGHEGHKTPIEIRPIPSLVNQMCLVYDQTSGQFVPQDLATYVENTPSFKNKIQEVAGTATLVAPDGTSLVATVKIFSDASYLPFSGNVAGDIAYTQDNNTMFIWDEVQYNWISTKAKSTTEIAEGTNLYFTNDRVGSYLSNNGFDTAANIVASIVDTAPATLDTLNELAAALGDDPNYATTVTTALGTKLNSADFDSTFDTRLATKSTDDIAEGSNLYYTDARAQAAITVNSTLSKTGGQISLPSSGVTAATYGSASAVPVFTVDTYGRITSATTTNVAGVSGFSYTAATNTYTITTSAGTTFDASGDLSSFDTADLAEGTNLYFTTSRARDSVSFAAGSGGYDATTGVITIPTNTDQLTNGAGFATTSYVDTVVAGKDNTDEITEGTTNLYFTTARARASISASGSLSYDSSTGELSFTLPPLDTDTVTEATNLYFTTARARESISATGSLSYDSATGIISFTQGSTDTVSEGSTNLYYTTTRFDDRLATKSTSDLAEGTNLYYTDARFDTRLATKTTSNLTEGTNLYFTTARAQGAISTSGGLLTYGSGVVGLTAEAIQDVIGAMVSNNSESAIAVTYNDAGNVLDFAVDTTTIATRTYVDDAIAALIDSAPGTLTTLSEIAAALGDDPNFASTITTQLTTKADKATIITAGTGLTGGGDLSTGRTISHADTSSQVSVDNSGNTFIQDITLDGFGHITGIASGTVSIGDGAMTVTAGTGLTGGGQLGTANQSGASSVTLSLATSGVTAGSYGSSTAIPVLTVDAYGRITAASTTAITVGNATLTVSAGSGLTGSGTFTANATTNNTITLSHADTSSVANLSSDNANGVVLQDIAFTYDTYGHVQTSSVTTVDLDGRYYTETEADSRFVNVTGDTMTGVLNIQTGGSTPDATTASYSEGLTLTGGNMRLVIDTSNVINGGAYIQTRHQSTTYPNAYYVLDLNPLGGNVKVNSNLVFHDGYHPNADKWTTARTNTVTLTGDVTGSGSASVDGSGNWTVSVPAVVVNDSHDHSNYAPRYAGNVTFQNNYVAAFTVVGSGLASAIRFTVQGTSGSVVIADTIDVIVQHYQDIVVKSFSGIYTTLTVKIQSNDNDQFTVYLKHNGGTTTTCNVEVFPLNSESVSFSPSTFTGSSIEHTCINAATAASATGGSTHRFYNNGNLVWDAGNDGSGSGLDADTVDGVHASSFSRYYEQSTNPGAVSNGSMWYNTATDKTYMRQGGAWVQISPSSSGIGIYDVNGTKVN